MSNKEQNHKVSKRTQKPISVPNRDGFARASFLFQAANSSCISNEPLSRMYLRSMDLVTKKSVLKVDPQVKRSFCKKCDRLQVPSVTSFLSLEDEGKRSEVYEVRCICGTRKRFPVGIDGDFKLFSEISEV